LLGLVLLVADNPVSHGVEEIMLTLGDIEGAGMGRPIGADQARPVDGEAHRQTLDRDIVHDLVIGALQEGRVDRGERLEAFAGQPGREGHAVLFGDGDVEGTLGKALGELVDAGARRHGRGNRADTVVGLGFGVLLVGLGWTASTLLGVNRPDSEKLSPYECGFEAFEDARMKFDVRYYLVAILFIVFDLEIAFLFPWAVALDSIGVIGLAAMGVFLLVLVVGFVYEWKKGALEWD